MKGQNVLVLVLCILAIFCIWKKANNKKENLSGFGVTSALHYYNPISVCSKGKGAWSGGCTIPHKIVV